MISYLKEMMNVFFYKVKAKQTVISICALRGRDSTTIEIAHHKMFLSDEEIPLAPRYHIEAASLNWFSENTISVFFMNETLQTLMEILTEMIT